MFVCDACQDTKEILVGIYEGYDEITCPCCTAWKAGFPGFGWKTRDGWIWFIEPSAPNELAKWKGIK